MVSGRQPKLDAELFTAVTLEPLSRDRGYRLLLKELDTNRIDTEVANELLSRANGIPLHLRELARHALESKMLKRRDDSVEATASWQPQSLPVQLSDMLSRRLSGLDDDDHCLLESASVCGDTFDPEDVAHLANTIADMQLRYVVITSVDRDDLRDGGAGHFVACIQAIRERSPNTQIEILVP